MRDYINLTGTGETGFPTEEEVGEMSVKELREILTRQKISFADCVEKSHLVDKVS